MLDKNLATLVGQLKVAALESGFVKAWEKDSAFGVEYINERTGMRVLLEMLPLGWGKQAELDLHFRKEIKGNTLPEVQVCIDTFQSSTQALQHLGYRGSFELGDNTLDSTYRAKASNLQECSKILSDFQSAAGKWTHGPVY